LIAVTQLRVVERSAPVSQQAIELSNEFARVMAEFTELVESVPDALWTTPLANDERPLNVVANHVGGAIEFELRILQAGADGADSIINWHDIDAANALGAEENAAVARSEALRTLRENIASAQAVIAGLSDEQLARVVNVPFLGGEVTVRQIVEWLLIGHPGMHAPDIRAAISA
jgi:hypothetical protein